ncbi:MULTISPECIES: M56 family metallopeptidase [Paenibacillus]|uniref:M56 family metallopeptidase n=2 Tax=Paenibacillus TaxID=44249 RepID=A0A7Y6BXC6_9BACL|nr:MULTISPECIES: M56 family metallopeptidase [Paenibacillus]MDN4603821.1 M56 family metallopeptidase [Paenibacillus vandeheii]NUU75694.1 M56 family metallopeptidase [Paenibacillus xylanilyticus]
MAIVICSLVIFQMGYVIYHQLQDVPSNDNIILLLQATITDMFVNHVTTEMIINAFIAFSVITFGYQVFNQYLRYMNMKKLLFQMEKLELSNGYSEKYNSLKIKIKVVSHPNKIAMSAGFFKSDIILSTSLLDQFNDEEIRAIIYHEYYHCTKRHPFYTVILKILSECYIFLPVIKKLASYYEVEMELKADQFVINKMKSTRQIGNVLLSLIKEHKREPMLKGVHLAHVAINYRLQQIIYPNAKLTVPILETHTILVSMITPIVMGIILIIDCA